MLHSMKSFERVLGEHNRHFLAMNVEKYCRNITAFNPTEELIAHLHAKAGEHISPIASLDTLLGIYRFNPDTVVAFTRGAYGEKPDGRDFGFLANLPLNNEGYIALLDGRLNTLEPDIKYICSQREKPAAVYYWVTYFTPQISGGMALAIERSTSAKRFKNIPMLCKTATPEGHSLMTSLGFAEGASYPDGRKSSEKLLQLQPLGLASGRPRYDTYVPGESCGTKKCSVTVVRNLDDFLNTMIIRSAAYVGEQYIPIAEDVDGNDISATHLLGYVGDQPAGCLRMRYFAGFMKFERLAVLAPFRKTRMAATLVRAGIAFGQMKGYDQFYGQAAPTYLRFWESFGFKRREGEGLRYLTDEVYFEIDLSTDKPNRFLTPTSGAAILVRPEGQWDRPGILEAGVQ